MSKHLLTFKINQYKSIVQEIELFIGIGTTKGKQSGNCLCLYLLEKYLMDGNIDLNEAEKTADLYIFFSTGVTTVGHLFPSPTSTDTLLGSGARVS